MKDKFEKLIKKYTKPKYINLVIALALLICGVYLIMTDNVLGVLLAFMGGYLLTADL